jgi:hypothetical protein
VFQRGVCEPDRQRLAFPVMEDLHFGHIRTPSLMASVGYAVIKNAPSAARFATAHVRVSSPLPCRRVALASLFGFGGLRREPPARPAPGSRVRP